MPLARSFVPMPAWRAPTPAPSPTRLPRPPEGTLQCHYPPTRAHASPTLPGVNLCIVHPLATALTTYLLLQTLLASTESIQFLQFNAAIQPLLWTTVYQCCVSARALPTQSVS